jgi:long-chain acyl-CoA synthetase
MIRKRPSNDLHTDIIAVNDAQTLPGLFRRRVTLRPDDEAYRQFDEVDQAWRSYSWKQIGERVQRWRAALYKEGLELGDRVAILHRNSIEWVCFDQAALSLGLVVVPLYTTDTPDNIAYILADSGARLLLTGSSEQWQALQIRPARLPGLERVLCLEGHASADPHVTAVDSWLKATDAECPPIPLETEGLATIVYTSGTTGRPKGVMLSHRNILWNAHAVLEAIPAYREDIFLSFLPLSHTFERTVGYYLPMMAGSSVAYARSVKTLAEDLVTIRPTVLISVPRIYERVYAKLQDVLAARGKLSQSLFRLTIELGWRRFRAAQGSGPSPTLVEQLIGSLLAHVLARKVLSRFGGRIRVAVSGGAPITETISRFFLGLGLPLLQGYGLTEAAPVVSGNRLNDNCPATVGTVIPGVEVRLGDRDELLVDSPGVMLGYWNQPRATGEVIDENGWLHTGDQIEFVNSHIRIRGRLKDIIVMSTGEKSAPADLELTITLNPLFEQAMVVGEGRPFLSALLVLNRNAWHDLATHLSVPHNDPASLEREDVHEAVLSELTKCLHGFPGHAQIHAVTLFLGQWTIAEGMLTPTMKLKRSAIEKNFRKDIDAMYTGH